jgi:hypothetical protein
VNVLDENILESQRQLLRSWGIPDRQIVLNVGRKGLADEDILPLLLTLSHPTLFTRDLGLAAGSFVHARYCLVILPIGQYEAAHFVRRLLRHPAFSTRARRMGTVIRVTPTGLSIWRLHTDQEQRLSWPD